MRWQPFVWGPLFGLILGVVVLLIVHGGVPILHYGAAPHVRAVPAPPAPPPVAHPPSPGPSQGGPQPMPLSRAARPQAGPTHAPQVGTAHVRSGPSLWVKTIAAVAFALIGLVLTFRKDNMQKTIGASLISAAATYFLGSMS
jgi:hypothetical protein